VIVLTSDHGELLGEDGRWGHAYYLFPQILQVPLIIHLPEGVRPSGPIDLGAAVFTTDIAPTLYAVLGYDPRPSNPLMGQSILTGGVDAALARRRGVHVVAASYSPVYGVIRRNGRRVYIVDAVSNTEYAYDRDTSGAWRAIAIDSGVRTINQRAIREHIDTIRRVYRMDAQP
jgi:arylsulfatase A-like enzyme